jgi:hypothetical protein
MQRRKESGLSRMRTVESHLKQVKLQWLKLDSHVKEKRTREEEEEEEEGEEEVVAAPVPRQIQWTLFLQP